jgi:hypothetical protein
MGDQDIKMQTFVNRCLRYILRIWWPNIIYNKDLWRVTGQEDINLEIIKRKFRWIGHTLRKEYGEIPKTALLWNPQGKGRQEYVRLTGEDRSSKKRAEAGMNYGSWQLIEVERAHRQTVFLKEQWTLLLLLLLSHDHIIWINPHHISPQHASPFPLQLSNCYINKMLVCDMSLCLFSLARSAWKGT